MSEQKTQSLLIPVLALLCFCGLLYLIVTQTAALRQTRQAAAAERIAVARAEEKLATLKQVRSRAGEMKERLEKCHSLVPVEADEDRLISRIQDMADMAGMRFLEIRFGERVPKDGYLEMPLDISFQGSYSSLLLLLDELQNGERAITVDEVKIGAGKEDLPQIKAEINATAYCCQEIKGAVEGSSAK